MDDLIPVELPIGRLLEACGFTRPGALYVAVDPAVTTGWAVVEAGCDVVVVEAHQCGKTARMEEMFSPREFTFSSQEPPCRPDYLRHDPTKSHRRRRP